jgi:hypothetical protein
VKSACVAENRSKILITGSIEMTAAPSWAKVPQLVTSRAFWWRHALFALILLAAIGIRGLATIAYRPALTFADSQEYLTIAVQPTPTGHRPVGYSLFLRELVLSGHLVIVPLMQHAMILGCGILIYMILLALGVRAWLAAFGSGPVLLDAYQVNIEQFVMPEALTQTLLLIAFVLIIWQGDRQLLLRTVAAGFILALAALTRTTVAPLVVPAALIVLVEQWRQRLIPAACLVAAFTAPLLGYALWHQTITGRFAASDMDSQVLYARVAPIADCARLQLSSRERALCPTQPLNDRPGPDFFNWDPQSPLWVPGNLRWAGSFAVRVITEQPVDYSMMLMHDTLHYFTPGRSVGDKDSPLTVWQFPTSAETPDLMPVSFIVGHDWVKSQPRIQPMAAAILQAYQSFGYTPGPVLALALAVAAVGGPNRIRLLGASGLLLLVVPSATAVFEYRYLLPALVLMPLAAAIGAERLLIRIPHPFGSRIGFRAGEPVKWVPTPSKR